jgi:hypothetical protein
MERPLDFEQFLTATRNILEEDGFAAYLPTLWVGDEILVVEGIPESVADTDALNDLGPEHGLGTAGTFFAVLAEPEKVVAGAAGLAGWRFVEIRPGESGPTVSSIERPLWFRL